MRIEDLKREYGLRTADSLLAPSDAHTASGAGHQENAADASPELSPDRAEAFRALGAVAVYVAGNIEGPEMRFSGDNMGAWPVLLGTTGTWRDTVTAQMDRFSPLKRRGVIFRLWTPDRTDAKQLLAAIEGLIRDRVDQLRGKWLDFGPDCDLELFAEECREVGRRIGVTTWDDAELVAELDKLIARTEEIARDSGRVVPIKGRGRR